MGDAHVRTADAIVIGGGPAGSAAASCLAKWGHHVVLLDRPSARPPLAESLPPSCRGLLEVTGLLGAVAGAGFVPSTGNTVWWGDGPQRVEHFPEGRVGLQVERARFDEVLRDAARAAGARVLRPATAREVRAADDGTGVVEAETPDGIETWRAPWVVDCTGRSGLTARRVRQGPDAALRTIAVAALHERPGGWGLPDESHTLVESAPWGWGWSVPVGPGRRHVTVMLHPSAVVPGEDGLAAAYADRLGQLPHLSSLVAAGRQVGRVFACDATTYDFEDGGVARPGVLVAGDAASCLDPLSSFGIKKALSSGWLAAVVVHTAVTTPASREAALALFAQRERDYVRAARAPLSSLSREAAGEGSAFWSLRAALDEGSAGEGELVARLREAPGMRQALQQLRDGRGRLRRHAMPTVMRPIVRDNLVVLVDHLRVGTDGEVRYLRNVDLVRLAELADGAADPGVVCAAALAEMRGVSLPDVVGGLAALVHWGAITFVA